MSPDSEDKYRDTIRRQRPVHTVGDGFSFRHPKMQMGQRAKIFSPFSALRGFGEAIDSKLEVYVEKAELSEEKLERINRVLHELAARRSGAGSAPVTLTYFVPCEDENHEAYGLGGQYRTLTGTVQRIDPYVRKAIWIGDLAVEFSDILDIRTERPAEEEVI